MRILNIHFLRIIALACPLLLAGRGISFAQLQRIGNVETQTEPVADTLSARGGAAPEDVLMAKVDSLRRAMEGAPDRRRREVVRRIEAADSLCMMYDFPAAVDILGGAAAESDSSTSRAVESAILRAQAGLKMMTGVSQVRVKARKRISMDDFFLIFPEAAQDEDARFHVSGADSRSLVFSARDRSGAGGYDLYVSRRHPQTGQWTESVNMGFPYSSPYNDYLYAEAGDGMHSVLVSDRGCPEDSVNVYVLAYDPLPPRMAVVDARQLRAIAELEPASGRHAPSPARSTGARIDMRAYTARTASVRVLRDSVAAYSRELDTLRAGLVNIAESDREDYLAGILSKEAEVSGMRERLDLASRELQRIEQQFLSGEVSTVSSLMQMPETPATDSTSTDLFVAEVDGDTVMMLSESGYAKPSIVLPKGAFSEYVEFPRTPSIRVRAVLDEDETLPPLAMTVIRLHCGERPETVEDGDVTIYTSAPFSTHSGAESLMMALRATGVSDVSLLED